MVGIGSQVYVSCIICKTVVRTVYCSSSGFEVKVGIHQGSALSPLLFVIVMEAISGEFRVALPWELLYADAGDLVVIAETEEDLIKRLNEWKNNVENRGVRVNMNKTKVENVRSQCRRLQDGRVMYVAEVLVVIQYNVLVVTRSVVA